MRLLCGLVYQRWVCLDELGETRIFLVQCDSFFAETRSPDIFEQETRILSILFSISVTWQEPSFFWN
jgi:hypothetical protein